MKNQDCTSRNKKSVRFLNVVRVKHIPGLQNFTESDINATYYGEAEYKTFRQDIRETVSRMSKGMKIDEAGFCSRGMESRTPAGLQAKRKNKMAAYDAIADELEKQIKGGYRNDAAVALAYSKASFESRFSAYLVGISDAQVAKSIVSTQKVARHQKGDRIGVEVRLQGFLHRNLSSAAA